jgi:hypothetical protein
MKPMHRITLLLCAALVLTGAGPAFAQRSEFQSPREIAAYLSERLPPFLKDDATRKRLVGEMLKVDLAPPLRSTFDPARAIKLLLGDGSVLLSTDCRRTGTPVGERDPGDCTASVGDETGAGAFSRLSYSKNLGFGNIKLVKRSAVPTQLPDPARLPSPAISDARAYEEARKLLAELGLPQSELPEVPAGAKGGLPVRNLNVRGGGQSVYAPITLQKVVFLRRGFPLLTPIPAGQEGTLTHVPGPGRAMVMFGADGLAGLSVQEWHELRLDPTITEGDTKTSQALVEEIAEDLFNEGVRSAVDVKFLPLIASEQRNQIGLLLPAVQVAVVPVPRDLDERSQNALARQATGGLVREYSLVERKEVTSTGRPGG